MVKLTKLQRHTAYIIMLAEADKLEYSKTICLLHDFCDNKRMGFCKLFEVTFGIDQENFFCLTELKNKRPPYFNQEFFGYWFNTDAWAIRKKLLKQCIEETY